MTSTLHQTTSPFRAVYVGTCSEPALYSLGIANHTSGFDDPESAEHLAWWFKPDDDESLYYVDEKELSFDVYEIAVREHLQRTNDNLELGHYLGHEQGPCNSVNVLFELHSFSLSDGLVAPATQRNPDDHRQSLEKLSGAPTAANT